MAGPRSSVGSSGAFRSCVSTAVMTLLRSRWLVGVVPEARVDVREVSAEDVELECVGAAGIRERGSLGRLCSVRFESVRPERRFPAFRGQGNGCGWYGSATCGSPARPPPARIPAAGAVWPCPTTREASVPSTLSSHVGFHGALCARRPNVGSSTNSASSRTPSRTPWTRTATSDLDQKWVTVPKTRRS